MARGVDNFTGRPQGVGPAIGSGDASGFTREPAEKLYGAGGKRSNFAAPDVAGNVMDSVMDKGGGQSALSS